MNANWSTTISFTGVFFSQFQLNERLSGQCIFDVCVCVLFQIFMYISSSSCNFHAINKSKFIYTLFQFNRAYVLHGQQKFVYVKLNCCHFLQFSIFVVVLTWLDFWWFRFHCFVYIYIFQLKLYHTVIDDVIAGVRDSFLDEGVDEQVLQEMKQVWTNKLMASKAVELTIEPLEQQPPPIIANNTPKSKVRMEIHGR